MELTPALPLTQQTRETIPCILSDRIAYRALVRPVLEYAAQLGILTPPVALRRSSREQHVRSQTNATTVPLQILCWNCLKMLNKATLKTHRKKTCFNVFMQNGS